MCSIVCVMYLLGICWMYGGCMLLCERCSCCVREVFVECIY